jgi:hypothetical protein
MFLRVLKIPALPSSQATVPSGRFTVVVGVEEEGIKI